MPRGLFDIPIEERLRPYLDYTTQSIPLVDTDKELEGISDALVDLPQDLIDAGRRFVTVIHQSRLDFTPYSYSFSQLASRFRCIQRRLALGPVPTYAHLSLFAHLIHDLCRDIQQRQDVNSFTSFMTSADSTVRQWFSEVGNPPHPSAPWNPRYTLNNRGEFEKVINTVTRSQCTS